MSNNKNKKQNQKNNKNNQSKISTKSTKDEHVYAKSKPTNKAKDAILKQYGLDDDYVPNTEKVEQVVADKIDAKVKGKVPCEADNIGWNKPLTLFKNAIFGVFMGVSDGVPGYSGGTTLNLFGFYEHLIKNVKMIFKPDVKKYFWKYLLWFLPFLIAWIGTLIGFMFIVREAGEANKGVVLTFLFGFFALFSIPLFIVSNKQKMPKFKDILVTTKQKSWPSIIKLIIFILAFLIIIVVGIVARFVSETHVIGVGNVQGVTFATSDFNVQILSSDTVSNVIPLLIFSFIAGFVIFIPGLSGSMIFFMCNWYTKIASIISNIISGEPGAIEGLPYLVVVVLGVIFGIICSTMLIHWVINRFSQQFYFASLGFVCGAFIAIFISLSKYDYGFLSDGTTLGLSIGMIFIALILNLSIFIYLNQTKKIDYPKLRLFKSHYQDNKTTSVKN